MTGESWRPSASRARLIERATLLARAREFFARRGVLEVDTPFIVSTAVSDAHVHSASVQLVSERGAPAQFFLHTSPEYAMKRLLAAGSGDIYQICHVARAFESGRLHNPEFTLIEWYRLGFSLDALMSEVDALVRLLLGEQARGRGSERLSYRDAFLGATGLDPLAAPAEALAAASVAAGLHAGRDTGRDECLDFLMGTVVGPRLGRDSLTFVYGYPASQAALARLDPADPRTAQRFELYADGIELANGFHELAAAAEQRARFEQDALERRRRGLPVHAPDEQLLAALASGLPDCSGVALGFDRVLMLASGAAHIREVLSFTTGQA